MEEQTFSLALAFIADLLAERVVVATRVILGWAAWSRDGQQYSARSLVQCYPNFLCSSLQ